MTGRRRGSSEDIMARKVILTCAVTGSADTVRRSKAVPVTPEQIARSAIEAGEAGAAVVHIHVRDPGTGAPSRELHLYREVVERIRASSSNVVLNLTTGPGGRLIPGDPDPQKPGPGTTLASPADRVRHIEELRPEICSLDVATMNMGEAAFLNTPAHLRAMGEAIRAVGTKPELEVFDFGHLRLASQLIEEGVIDSPALIQVVTGVAWGMPASPSVLTELTRHLPAGANWAAFGISRMAYPMMAQAVLLGGHARIGLEDCLHLEAGVPAPSNAALVEKATRLIRLLGAEVASPDEARQILGLRGTQ